MGCFSSILFPGKIKITTHVFSASALAGPTSHIQFGFFFSKEFLGINSTFRLVFFPQPLLIMQEEEKHPKPKWVLGSARHLHITHWTPCQPCQVDIINAVFYKGTPKPRQVKSCDCKVLDGSDWDWLAPRLVPLSPHLPFPPHFPSRTVNSHKDVDSWALFHHRRQEEALSYSWRQLPNHWLASQDPSLAVPL